MEIEEETGWLIDCLLHGSYPLGTAGIEVILGRVGSDRGPRKQADLSGFRERWSRHLMIWERFWNNVASVSSLLRGRRWRFCHIPDLECGQGLKTAV